VNFAPAPLRLNVALKEYWRCNASLVADSGGTNPLGRLTFAAAVL
jgi:hypothetical protein